MKAMRDSSHHLHVWQIPVPFLFSLILNNQENKNDCIEYSKVYVRLTLVMKSHKLDYMLLNI